MMKSKQGLFTQPAVKRIALILLLVAGFVLRAVGYDWGLPFATNQPDEGKVYIGSLEMLEKGTFLSSGVVYPTQITQKVLAGILLLARRVVPIIINRAMTEVDVVHICDC